MSIAIAEIAGRDSVAAAVAATRGRGFTQLLPTIALTGTETGNMEAPLRAVEVLEAILGDSVEVLEAVFVQDQSLWSAMNARFASVIQERYSICSPCLSCHLYMHLLRAPLAWELGNIPVIAGERDTHDGRIKLSQTTASIDAAARVLAHGGIELIQPIRDGSGDDVARLVGGNWDEGGEQLGCLLSGNYVAPDGSVTYDEAGYSRYIDEFFEPVGKAVLDAWRAQGEGETPAPNFIHLVAEILETA